MIMIKINGESRQYSTGIESWITQQINQRKQDGRVVCVEVSIRMEPLNLDLRTPGCTSSGGGGGRKPTASEQRIFDLWAGLGLQDPNFTGGQVVAFLKQLRRNT